METFTDYLKDIVIKYGEKSLNIGNYRAKLCNGNRFPYIELKFKDGKKFQHVTIWNDGKLEYERQPPLYVSKHLEKCITNMLYHFLYTYPIYKKLRSEYNPEKQTV